MSNDPVKLMDEAEGAAPPALASPTEALKPKVPQARWLSFQTCGGCAEEKCGCGRTFLVLSREPGGESPIAEAVLKPDMAERLVLELARHAPLTGDTLEGLALELFELADAARQLEEAHRMARRH